MHKWLGDELAYIDFENGIEVVIVRTVFLCQNEFKQLKPGTAS